MSKIQSNLIKSIFVIVSLFSVVVLFLTYKTFIGLFNLQFYKESENPITTVVEFENQFTSYPPINTASIPIIALKAPLLFKEDRVVEAKQSLAKASLINPYYGYSDYVLGNYFYFEGVIDSSYYYADRAFKKWPKSIVNFELINKVYAHEGDTLSIIKTYDQIKDFFSDREEYYDSFIKYYSLGKYFYYDIEYNDQESLSNEQLIGEWIKVNNRKDGGIRVQLNSKLEFLPNGFLKSQNKFYLFDKAQDTVFLRFQNNPNKVISKFLVKYSPKWKTLIVNFNNSSEDKNEFFRKTSELDLDK
ncbi:hypothetical protein OAA74_02700 [Flavobacteriaceae bacterium]|nr:hypothetical protein [Flavobacteriaceae bacterium]